VLTGVSNHSNPALHGGDLQHIFTDFMNQKVGGFTRTPLREEPANGYAMGVIGHDGGARISLGEQRQPYQTFWDAYFTIGELFHVSGSKSTYSDEVLAKYVHFNTRYGKDENRSIRPEENIFSPRYQNQKDGAEYGYSTYFHRIQQSVCFVPSQSL
jgi:hypothetical protein